MLRAVDLHKSYGRKPILMGVSLAVGPEEVVGLLGPNGAGKTTTFQLIAGLSEPDRGSIRLDELEITGWPFYRKARLGIGYLPQEPSVFRKLSVLQNLTLILARQERHPGVRREQAEALLEKLGVLHLRDQVADTLSTGERRRVEIARALAAEPRYLLLDEPFTGIDPRTIEELQTIVLQLKSEGLGMVITDHNVRETLDVADRICLIQGGRLYWEGPPAELTEHEGARTSYLGERFRR